MKTVHALLSLTLLALSTSAASAFDIVACGQVVGAGEVGDLRRDLDCPSERLGGVGLIDGATLNLNGFVLRGGGGGTGVACTPQRRTRGTCTVNGPGEITGFEIGVGGVGCRLVVHDLLLRGNGYGLAAPLVCDVEAQNVTAVENRRDGIQAQRVRGRNLTARGNGRGGVTATKRIDVHALDATGNGEIGVSAQRGRIVDSTVVENGAGADGLDIAGYRRLRLERVQCGRSVKLKARRARHLEPGAPLPEPRIVGSFGCLAD